MPVSKEGDYTAALLIILNVRIDALRIDDGIEYYFAAFNR